MINHLREARRSAGWSQRTLAARIGVDAQVIKRLEQGVGAVTALVSVMEVLELHMAGIGPGRTLPEQLAACRRRRGLPVSAIAALTGLSRAKVASIERGGGSVASLMRLMSALAPQARRRARERSYWGQAKKIDRDSRFTPASFMAPIYTAFGDIDLDPCANVLSPVVAHRRILLDKGGDGLRDPWSGKIAFVNPPFSELLLWLRRAYEQWQAGNIRTVICLIPVRTDSAWFHDVLSADADFYLLKGRVRFLNAEGKGQHTPFSLMLLTLGATANHKARYAELVPGFWLSRSQAASGQTAA